MSWLNPSSWAGFMPNGLGQVKPNHYFEMVKTIWQNRDQLPFAVRILTQGVCDGCALGTSGVRDFTLEGVHLCTVRLNLLRMNTSPPFDPLILEDVTQLKDKTSKDLRLLGRLPRPMLRRKGERGFKQI